MKHSYIGLVAAAALLTGAFSTIGLQPVHAKPVKCPDTWTGLNCDYFRDGYKAGRGDRKANMSMYYGRHSGAYDSRFEQYFREGYEAGWQGTTY
ncbi:MAG: hypothetical protein VKO39_02690 [Cyanobacteriota bacterium]|nr:hypothetical protein [Cyanobacteriota bacterium]